ncbi:universal stress protein [Alkalilacustris brevis]|uniref:universal stress protein n=1 Tax=Alkalilacustris brevis TaxID=2026338 RepID=UPI0013902935|nr:universal stress protein [Alkalilacustris brevis]
MSIKSILATYTGSASGASGLGLAVHMAKKYDAHLTGVVWHGPSMMESHYSQYMTADIEEILRARDSEVVAGIRADFDKRVAEAGLEGRAEFLDLSSGSDLSLAECARAYDVVVMGLAELDMGQRNFAARPDVVALRSGRPVILVPSEYAVESLVENALIAWDGKRAAARALGDAMHILETKEKVTVLTVGEAPPARPGADITDLLHRHGIEAERIVRAPGRKGTGHTILDAAREVGAGLLIMGAYEHSKFSEDLMGGVTRDILENAHLPVLMSH